LTEFHVIIDIYSLNLKDTFFSKVLSRYSDKNARTRFVTKGNLSRKGQGAKLPAWDQKVMAEGLPEKQMKRFQIQEAGPILRDRLFVFSHPAQPQQIRNLPSRFAGGRGHEYP